MAIEIVDLSSYKMVLCKRLPEGQRVKFVLDV